MSLMNLLSSLCNGTLLCNLIPQFTVDIACLAHARCIIQMLADISRNLLYLLVELGLGTREFPFAYLRELFPRIHVSPQCPEVLRCEPATDIPLDKLGKLIFGNLEKRLSLFNSFEDLLHLFGNFSGKRVTVFNLFLTDEVELHFPTFNQHMLRK